MSGMSCRSALYNSNCITWLNNRLGLSGYEYAQAGLKFYDASKPFFSGFSSISMEYQIAFRVQAV